MAGYAVRSLAELSSQARSFFTQSIPGAIASVWANTFTVIGKVIALLNFEHELRRKWLFAQMFASTADDAWLARHGFELGLSQAPAASAYGEITVGAVPGLVVPGALQFVRDDGATFTSFISDAAVGTSVTLTLEADVAGAAGNTDAGTVLTLVDTDEAPVGLALVGTVTSAGLGGGTDLEPIERFRARVLARKRRVAQGGAPDDYETWAREALSSVASVWVDSFQNDARSVWVAFTVNDQAEGLPTPAQVAIVQAYLDERLRRPVTARVFAVAPVAQAVPILIGGLTPDTPAIRAAILAELEAVFIDRIEPGKPSAPAILSRSWLSEAVSRATGEERHRIVAPASDLSFGAGLLPTLGAVSYTI